MAEGAHVTTPGPTGTIEVRPLSDRSELDRLLELPYTLNHELADDVEAGRRRPPWLWIALLDGVVVARLGWWGEAGADRPTLLDLFDVRDPTDPSHLEAARMLLRANLDVVVGSDLSGLEYQRNVVPDWRGRSRARRETEVLTELVAATGARLLAERLRLTWQAGTPIPPPSGRLRFREPAGDDEVVGLMTEVVEGTLDAHTRQDLRTMSPAEAARDHFDGDLARQLSPRANWRVATTPDGEVVGFVTPGRNHYNPVIGYLAVLPAHRGRGHVDDILNEGVRVLAGQGVDHVRAATDLGNTPMAAAFVRSGWTAFEHAITMSWSPAEVDADRKG